MEHDIAKLVLPILEAGGPTALLGYLIYIQRTSTTSSTVDNQILALVLTEVRGLQKEVGQVSKDLGTYQSAHEKAARDRYDELNAGVQHIMGGQKDIIDRLGRLECSS